MRRYSPILLLLALLGLSGCVEPLVHETPRLYLRIDLPQEYLTKAEIGDEPSFSDERTLKNLHVWVFKHDDPESATGYYKKFDDLSLIKTGREDIWYLELPEAVAKAKPNVDVYAIANYNTSFITNISAGNNTTRQQLEAALVTGFGTASPVTSVSNNGLPFSAVKKNIPMNGSYPLLELEPLTLVRAVAKITFLLCQVCVDDEDKTLVENYSISNLTIPGNQIRSKEYLFNNTGTSMHINTDGGFDAAAIDVSVTELARNPFPERYSFRSALYPNETTSQYGARIQEAIDAGLLTRKVYYLRESDQKLTGSFSYQVGLNPPVNQSFTMSADGDFARNHDWIVYIYFVADDIKFSVSWVDWLQGGAHYLTNEGD